jgi:hypothetical protein
LHYGCSQLSAFIRHVHRQHGVFGPFRDRYEDGDGEDITPEELEEILVDKEGVQRRRRDLLEALAADAAAAGARGENDENAGGPACSSREPERRPVAAVLGEATERSRNVALPSQERRSK